MFIFMESILSFDMSVLNFIYDNIRCSFLDFLMPIVTLFGESGIFYICIAVLMMLFKKTRKTGFMLSLSLIIGLIICNITLKPLVARPRPYTIREDVLLLVERLNDFSFPSGHTVAAFEASTVMMMRNRRIGILFLILAFLISFSRLYLYVHYPTDIIAGIIVGTISGIVSVTVINFIHKRIKSESLLP